MAKAESKPVFGVILAGGRGTRLAPLTDVCNKHLLPVYDRPMIFHTLAAFRAAGIFEVAIATNRGDLPAMSDAIGPAKRHGLESIKLVPQYEPRGVADALSVVESVCAGRRLCVVLGDNLFGEPFAPLLARFETERPEAMFTLARIDDPDRLRGYGVARFESSPTNPHANPKQPLGPLIDIEEKPETPASNYAVAGLYFYNPQVLSLCKLVKPSARGEREITDLNRLYIQRGNTSYALLQGWWIDAGTPDDLLRAGNLARESMVATAAAAATESHPRRHVKTPRTS